MDKKKCEVVACVDETVSDVKSKKTAREDACTIKIKTSLAQAYNAASGLLEGLEHLKTLPNSKFTYAVREYVGSLAINTNIPVRNLGAFGSSASSLSMVVESNGLTKIWGGHVYTQDMMRYADESKRLNLNTGGMKKGLQFITQKAVQNNLV